MLSMLSTFHERAAVLSGQVSGDCIGRDKVRRAAHIVAAFHVNPQGSEEDFPLVGRKLCEKIIVKCEGGRHHLCHECPTRVRKGKHLSAVIPGVLLHVHESAVRKSCNGSSCARLVDRCHAGHCRYPLARVVVDGGKHYPLHGCQVEFAKAHLEA